MYNIFRRRGKRKLLPCILTFLSVIYIGRWQLNKLFRFMYLFFYHLIHSRGDTPYYFKSLQSIIHPKRLLKSLIWSIHYYLTTLPKQEFKVLLAWKGGPEMWLLGWSTSGAAQIGSGCLWFPIACLPTQRTICGWTLQRPCSNEASYGYSAWHFNDLKQQSILFVTQH